MNRSRLLLPPIPSELRALMAEVGPKWRTNVAGHVDLMIQQFSEVLKDSPREGVNVSCDISYGDHTRQVIDVYLPDEITEPPPVVYLAQHGIAGINIGYRLADHATYPGATLDIGRVVAWTRAHATRYGWDPRRIFLMSHSAGGAHAGSYGYNRRFWPAGGSLLAGMILVSGRVRADNLPENPNARKVEQYYGLDDTKFDDYSPVTHVDADSLPTFVAWAEFENPLIDVYSAELVYRLANAKRRSPPSMWLAGHNHTSAIAHIGTSDERLGQAIVDFVNNPR
jgi:hypothetical protein